MAESSGESSEGRRLVLVRHGRTTANSSGVLAGRTAGVKLDETGVGQAQRAGERLAVVPLTAVVTSPLERCRQTARAILKAQTGTPLTATERGITECDYGEWQGRALKDLAKEPLWKTVQGQPSAAVFPGGESMVTMQSRAVTAVRGSARLHGRHNGRPGRWQQTHTDPVARSSSASHTGRACDVVPAGATGVRRPGDDGEVRRPGDGSGLR